MNRLIGDTRSVSPRSSNLMAGTGPVSQPFCTGAQHNFSTPGKSGFVVHPERHTNWQRWCCTSSVRSTEIVWLWTEWTMKGLHTMSWVLHNICSTTKPKVDSVWKLPWTQEQWALQTVTLGVGPHKTKNNADSICVEKTEPLTLMGPAESWCPSIGRTSLDLPSSIRKLQKFLRRFWSTWLGFGPPIS